METIRLPDVFKEFLNLLNEKQVEYLVVGGYVVNIYGYNRATGDIDIWVAVSAENSARVVEVFHDFGFGSLGLEPDAFNKENLILNIGVKPLKIEVMTSIAGVDFDECFQQRVEYIVDGVKLNVISFDHLLHNKKSTGRLKDLADAEELEKYR